MYRRKFIVASACALILSVQPAVAADQKPLELFGVSLKGATRDQLRQTFKQNGLRAKREDNNYWVDTYDAKGVLDGASDFQVGYVLATGNFAYAQYTFSGFMDTQLVGKVISMVATKYGRPASQSGNYGLGEVSAKWNMGQGMFIEVSRGWPDTTTYLNYIDSSANKQMNVEIDAEKKAQATQKAKAQSKAF
jgi:hypothetical protein